MISWSKLLVVSRQSERKKLHSFDLCWFSKATIYIQHLNGTKCLLVFEQWTSTICFWSFLIFFFRYPFENLDSLPTLFLCRQFSCCAKFEIILMHFFIVMSHKWGCDPWTDNDFPIDYSKWKPFDPVKEWNCSRFDGENVFILPIEMNEWLNIQMKLFKFVIKSNTVCCDLVFLVFLFSSYSEDEKTASSHLFVLWTHSRFVCN